MKYYFITYSAKSASGHSVWNDVINCSPMKFIKDTEEAEGKGSKVYYDFIVTNTLEITKSEFEEFELEF